MDISLGRFFSAAEAARLEEGLPRLGEWSSAMLVSFEARQLRRARVLWINECWFLERQINVSRADTHDRVGDWLLEEFAYGVPRNATPRMDTRRE